MKVIRHVEALLEGTPFEKVARQAWAQLRSIGRPRARQSLRYDAQTRQIMRRVICPSSNCVDAGAHRGSFLEEMLALAPRGNHFAFEPIPHLARRLSERFPSVETRQAALASAPGVRDFSWVVDDPGLSGFRTSGHVKPEARIERIRVPTVRLDDVLPPGLPIRFIKIDVEGAEYEVLRGAERTLSRHRPYIVFEHGMLAHDGFGTTSEMLYDLLVDECGLRVSLLEDWLAGAVSLTRDQFSGHVGYHATSHFCFLAHPPPNS